MTANPDIIELAQRFSRALDQEDYGIVQPMLAADCRYAARNEAVFGPEAIIASYRTQSALARKLFDRVEYSSAVSQISIDTASIVFSDCLVSDGNKHVYKCGQIVHVGADGVIDAIQHREFPGERARLLRFCADSGVSLD